MRKLTILFAITCAALFAFSTASAETFRAVVIDPAGPCGLPDGNGGVYITNDTQVVGAHSANGNSKLTCKAIGVPNDTGSAVRWDAASFGSLCGIPSPHGLILTDDWKATVSSEGDATLQCRFKFD